jgi:hypothetical protein
MMVSGSSVLTPVLSVLGFCLYKKSLKEVAEPASFENKVDQLWQSILTELFPFQEDYMVFGRDRVDHQPNAADMMVKTLAGPAKDVVGIIFTLSNKRAQDVGDDKIWREALRQLKEYLRIERESSTDSKMDPQHGAVAIGRRVRFYQYFRNGPNTRNDGQLHPAGDYDVMKDQTKVQRSLLAIKKQAEKQAERLG